MESAARFVTIQFGIFKILLLTIKSQDSSPVLAALYKIETKSPHYDACSKTHLVLIQLLSPNFADARIRSSSTIPRSQKRKVILRMESNSTDFQIILPYQLASRCTSRHELLQFQYSFRFSFSFSFDFSFSFSSVSASISDSASISMN